MAQRVVVVTGASAGLGRAVARGFGEHGATVALLARGTDGLEATAKDLESVGGAALAIPTDVADPDAVEAAAQQVESELGEIDVWVNDAMTGIFAPLWEITPAEFKRVTEVNYLGFVYGTMAALGRMRARDRGTIVQVGSALAYRGIPLQSAYCGSKHAIQGFTESLRCELLHEKSRVQVTMVQMPAMNTPQFGWVRNKMSHHAQPVAPIYQPEVAAQAVVYAADHPDRHEYHVGASTTATVFANKFAAGLLDRYLGRTGFASQQTDEAIDSDAPDNLWCPLPGDHGAHGIFDSQAKSSSPQWWLTTHKAMLAGAGAGVVAVLGGVAAAGRRQ